MATAASTLEGIDVKLTGDASVLVQAFSQAIKQTQELSKAQAAAEAAQKRLSKVMEAAGSALKNYGTAAASLAGGVAGAALAVVAFANSVDGAGAAEWNRGFSELQDSVAGVAVSLATDLRPAFLAVMKVATEVVQFIGRIDFRRWADDVTETLRVIWAAFGRLGGTLMSWGRKVADFLADAFIGFGGMVLLNFKTVFDAIGSGTKALGLDGITAKLERASRLVDTMATDLSETSGHKLVDAFEADASQLFNAISSGARGAWDDFVTKYATKTPIKVHVRTEFDALGDERRSMLADLSNRQAKLALAAQEATNKVNAAEGARQGAALEMAGARVASQYDHATQALADVLQRGDFMAVAGAQERVRLAEQAVQVQLAGEQRLRDLQLGRAREYEAKLQEQFGAAQEASAKALAAALAASANDGTPQALEAAKKVKELSDKAGERAMELQAKVTEATISRIAIEVDGAKKKAAIELEAVEKQRALWKAMEAARAANQAPAKALMDNTGIGGIVGRAQSAAAMGAMAGGVGAPVAALISVFADLIAKSKQYAETQARLDSLLQSVADTVGGVLAPFNSLLGGLQTLAPAITMLTPVFEAIGRSALSAATHGVSDLLIALAPLAPFLDELKPVLDAFGRMRDALSVGPEVLAQLLSSFRFYFEGPIASFVQGIGDVATLVESAFAPQLALLAQALAAVAPLFVSIANDGFGLLFDGVRLFGEGLAKAVSAIDLVIAQVTFFVRDALWTIGNLLGSDTLRDRGDQLSGIGDGFMDASWKAGIAATALSELELSTLRASGAQEKLSQTLAESLSNVPSSYYVARVRGQVLSEQTSSSSGPESYGTTWEERQAEDRARDKEAGYGVVITGPVTVVASDPEALMRELQDRTARDNVRRYGRRSTAPGSYSGGA